MKVYIAAPFFNEEQIKIVEQVELCLESRNIEYFSPRSEGTLSAMTREEQEASRKAIFQSNVDNMGLCTHMIACVDFKDTGTIWEMGFMFAQGKGIVMMAYDSSKVNVMLAESAIGIAGSPTHAADILLGVAVGKEIGQYE
jgi:nucleoside 2-deoxyribosyltransferase